MRIVASALAAFLAHSTAAHAVVDVTIQPSSDLADIVWTVEWPSLEGGIFDFFETGFQWDSMDPQNGNVSQVNPLGRLEEVVFFDIGDPFGSVYAEGNGRGFLNTVDGVVSTPGGFGVGPDDNGDEDGLWLLNTTGTGTVPDEGFFQLVVPGANLQNYNLGVYESDYVRVEVTATSLSATDTTASVPEPGVLSLLAGGVAALVGLRRVKRQAA